MTDTNQNTASAMMQAALEKALAQWKTEHPGVEPTRDELAGLMALHCFSPAGINRLDRTAKTEAAETVEIGATQMPVLTYKGQRVVTLPMVDQVHQRRSKTALRNFKEHRARFILGEDYFETDQGDEIRSLGVSRPQGGTPEKLILLTETGYLMLVKSFTDDLAWQVQRRMVTSYFATRRIATDFEAQLSDFREALEGLEEHAERLRLMTLAGNSLWNRIARLQEAGCSLLALPTVLRCSQRQVDRILDAMVEAGLIRDRDWTGSRPSKHFMTPVTPLPAVDEMVQQSLEV